MQFLHISNSSNFLAAIELFLWPTTWLPLVHVQWLRLEPQWRVTLPVPGLSQATVTSIRSMSALLYMVVFGPLSIRSLLFLIGRFGT